MKYRKIITGTFVDRPNRFIADVIIDGADDSDSVTRCHVKNTGKCKELLVKGAKVFLSVSDNPERKTTLDLVAVKKGDRLINMDSQIPNDVAAESLTAIPEFADVKCMRREYKYGDSRIDIFASDSERRFLVEVKGVTMERDGVVLFPDAPTERGVKHLNELIKAKDDGYIPFVLFVIQMENVDHFSPNSETDPLFSETLRKASESGVGILAYDCVVTPDSLRLGKRVEVIL